MNKLFFSLLLVIALTFFLHAENNSTKDNNMSKEHNITAKIEKKSDTNKTKSKSSLTEQQVKEQMEREKKYAKEQSFAQGNDYDLKAVEVNEESLKNIPLIEPDYDFDITDVYRDDI